MTGLVRIEEPSGLAEARRAAQALATRLGFGEAAAGRAAIVASELASNLLKHAGRGELLIQAIEDARGPLVELLALDRGGGIGDVGAAMQDGVSTAGTAGTGLGAVRRLSQIFDLYSGPKGTVVLARVGPDAGLGEPARSERVSGIDTPMARETVCGDTWCFERPGPGRTSILVADGLGHGPMAATASQAAATAFRHAYKHGPKQAVEAIHLALRPTRGAAVAVLELDREAGTAEFCGVGNISGSLHVGGEMKRMISQNGTAGAAARRIQSYVYPFEARAVAVMHSDGLTGSWRLEDYPGLVGRDPALLAGVLYRDASRGTDDVSVVVAAPP